MSATLLRKLSETPLRKLGEALLKLGDNPKAYAATPPERLTGVAPTFGIERFKRTLPFHLEADYSVVVDPYDPNRNFIKSITDQRIQNILNEEVIPRPKALPPKHQGEVSVIDSMVSGRGGEGGGGWAEYYRLWDDDLANNRLNISTHLTPTNEIRRPVNMLNYFVRRPEAGENIRLYDDASSNMINMAIDPHIFSAMPIEEKIGYLALKEREDQLRRIPHSLSIEDVVKWAQQPHNTRPTPFGANSLTRGEAVSSMSEVLRRGGDIDEAVGPYADKVLFKKRGGLARYADLTRVCQKAA